MYSLVSAPVLGFDLVRLPGGSAVAELLLAGLTLTPRDLTALALSRADDWERAGLWREVDAAARERRAANEVAGALTLLERAPLGTVDGLLHCVRYDVLAWTWTDPAGHPARGQRAGDPPARALTPMPVTRATGRRQSTTAARATGVLCDALAAAYLRELLADETRRRLSAPWVAAARELTGGSGRVPRQAGPARERRVDLGPQQPVLDQLLTRVAALSADDVSRLVGAAEAARRGVADWAPAVHSASWVVFLTGRVRAAAAAQLLLVQAIDRAGVPVGERAGGVWNLLSGAVQALVVADVLDGPTADRLIDPYRAVLGPLAETMS